MHTKPRGKLVAGTFFGGKTNRSAQSWNESRIFRNFSAAGKNPRGCRSMNWEQKHRGRDELGRRLEIKAAAKFGFFPYLEC